MSENNKIIDRIRKLLRLAADGGATEHEAALAAERAAELMQEHGLSNATIEASGGEGEQRGHGQRVGGSQHQWMRDLMNALCKMSFVSVELTVEYDKVRGRAKRGYSLIGRESAVVTVRMMHEYLCSTVGRIAREHGTPGDELFKEGCGSRLVERVLERHETDMRRQREDAERRREAAEAAGQTANALVIMDDYAQSEQDANSDMRRGVPHGTTARERAEQEGRIAARKLQMDTLQKQGICWGVAWYMVYAGMTKERAELRYAEEQTAKHDAKAAKETAAGQSRYERAWRRMQERHNAKVSHPSYREGRRRAEDIGLDPQIDSKGAAKRLLPE